ncbi:uncharacterized protein EDB93DRAFT_1126036 [Suillus bovinus]|uniref:uncharacterized protein n=1 Tax=Suillus bovinus TaxID=48563 RepID=UPI001B87C452|nr:uncharacterized protein EDB93DRAFT_1126036 [Suillus bovinus]KAG2156865.1 hypothetical protein EDB93DRAFT_1126036 [Suillus bovinus]
MTLALTCKSFSGPALDLLWRDLRGVEPLIKCLPQSLWKQDKKKLEFQRTMTLDDWAIFCKYNYRVRSLVHQCHESYMHTEMICSTEIWRALSCPPFSLPLLPNLTSLTWTEASNETFPHIQLFATPQLTKLTISVSTYGPSFTFGPSEESILSSIAKSCPSVSQFDFAQEKDDSMESVGAMLQFWSHLTSVKTGTISEAAILHLSNLPSLRVLKCGLPSTSISTRAQELLQHDVFCALQDLHITCKSLANLEAFLEKLTIAPKVLSFLITPSRGGVDFVRTLPDLISRLSNACTHSSLQEVRLSIRVNRSADPEASIGALAFQPLFAFRNLRVLDFRADNCCIVRIDDASLLQMAKAWPHLEELYISRYSHSSYRVTLHAFVLLLWHCPRLRSVAVLIDWSTIDVHTIPPDIPYQGFSQKALTKLFINGWRIENPTSIAAFISAIAPNVRSIDGWDTDYHGYDSDGIDNSWTVVQSLIATLPMVREQGKRMILNRLARGSHNYHVIAQRGGRS